MKRFLVTTLALIAVATYTIEETSKKIRLYCMYTPSHEVLYKEWFLPTLQDDYEVVSSCFKQECQRGAFMSKGWAKTIIHKIDIILRGIEENWGQVFVFSDVDIQFFAPTWPTLSLLIENHDIIMQRCWNGSKKVNTGFFACRANKRNLATWQEARRLVQKGIDSGKERDDQQSFNKVLKRNPFNLQVGFLPPTFLKGGFFERKPWTPKQKMRVPNGTIMHHACWTQGGLEDKILQLRYVKQVMEKISIVPRASKTAIATACN